MFRRLLGWLAFALGSSGRRAIAYLLIALAVVAVFWAVFVPDFQIVLDPAAILLGVAACIVAWTLYTLSARRAAAATSVAVTYDLRLAQPTFRGGRYRFELEIFYEVHAGSRRERSRQARIELMFKRDDHPDLFEWTHAQVGEYLRAHRRLAARRFPGAHVVALPAPSRASRAPAQVPEILPREPDGDDDAAPKLSSRA